MDDVANHSVESDADHYTAVSGLVGVGVMEVLAMVLQHHWSAWVGAVEELRHHKGGIAASGAEMSMPWLRSAVDKVQTIRAFVMPWSACRVTVRIL